MIFPSYVELVVVLFPFFASLPIVTQSQDIPQAISWISVDVSGKLGSSN